MRKLRALVRLFRLVHESLALFGVFTIGRVALLPASIATRRAWRRFMYQWWARRVVAGFAIKVTYEGDTPEGAFILASNHLSYVDIPVLAQRVDAAFVAKSEVKTWPMVGMLAASVGTIFVNRESRRDAIRVGAEIIKTTRENRGVALFPEGTATDGSTLLPFKASLLEVAALHGIPVHGVALRYESDEARYPAAQFICWAGDDGFGDHVWRLLQLRGGRAVVHFGPPRVSSDRKELAQQLWSDVHERLRHEPSVNPPER